MTNSIYGVGGTSSPLSAYSAQQSAKKDKIAKQPSAVETKAWKSVSPESALVPTEKAGYGATVGDVNLSDKAKEYYAKLKEKFGNVDFLLVSKDMKEQVEANASRYGSAARPIVLIDDEKIERMANDPAYAKKFEGIIQSSLDKLEAARNSLAASGATIKNFGMSVGADGKTSFFAVIEKASDSANKIREKNIAKHKAEKADEKKKAEKKDAKERLEKLSGDDKEYIEFSSESLEDLIDKVSRYAFNDSARSLESQEGLGQSIDFKG
ncbi:MAG: hypothetical protein IJL90_06860 [Lachnospiraceae bacterium]|nr:hypothetical protein [Lachnospiraceae bacterium]MBQ6575807.1 hypothetical protein [Lachnospiraceae bacterium]